MKTKNSKANPQAQKAVRCSAWLGVSFMAVGAWKVDEKSGDGSCNDTDKNGTPRSHRREKMNRHLRMQPEHLTCGERKQCARQEQQEAWTPRDKPGECKCGE